MAWRGTCKNNVMKTTREMLSRLLRMTVMDNYVGAKRGAEGRKEGNREGKGAAKKKKPFRSVGRSAVQQISSL